MRARDAYGDAAIVFTGQPGAYADTGPIGSARLAASDHADEYRAVVERIRRLHQDGPER